MKNNKIIVLLVIIIVILLAGMAMFGISYTKKMIYDDAVQHIDEKQIKKNLEDEIMEYTNMAEVEDTIEDIIIDDYSIKKGNHKNDIQVWVNIEVVYDVGRMKVDNILMFYRPHGFFNRSFEYLNSSNSFVEAEFIYNISPYLTPAKIKNIIEARVTNVLPQMTVCRLTASGEPSYGALDILGEVYQLEDTGKVEYYVQFGYGYEAFIYWVDVTWNDQTYDWDVEVYIYPQCERLSDDKDLGYSKQYSGTEYLDEECLETVCDCDNPFIKKFSE